MPASGRDRGRNMSFGYTRVSTRPAGRQGAGLEAQRDAIPVECKRRGWQLARVEQDVLSGKNDEAARTPRQRWAPAAPARSAGSSSRSSTGCPGAWSTSVRLAEANARRLEHRRPRLRPRPRHARRGRSLANVLMSVRGSGERRGDRPADQRRDWPSSERKECRWGGRAPVSAKGCTPASSELASRGDSLRKIADRLNSTEVATGHGGDRWHPSTVSAVLQRAV